VEENEIQGQVLRKEEVAFEGWVFDGGFVVESLRWYRHTQAVKK